MILINQNQETLGGSFKNRKGLARNFPTFPTPVLLFFPHSPPKACAHQHVLRPPPLQLSLVGTRGGIGPPRPPLHAFPYAATLRRRALRRTEEEFAKGRRGAARMTRKACCVVPAASVAARGKQRGQLGSRKGRRKAPSPTSTLLSVLSAAAQGVSRARKSAPGVGVDRRRKNAKRHRGSSLDLIAQAAERFPVGGGFK